MQPTAFVSLIFSFQYAGPCVKEIIDNTAVLHTRCFPIHTTERSPDFLATRRMQNPLSFAIELDVQLVPSVESVKYLCATRFANIS